MYNLINTIYDETLKNNGASYNLDNVAPTKGFMVATFGNELVINQKDFTKEILKNFIESKLELLQNKNYCVGTWMDDGKVYLDISENIKNKNKAIFKGKINKQIAIFDLSSFESVYL